MLQCPYTGASIASGLTNVFGAASFHVLFHQISNYVIAITQISTTDQSMQCDKQANPVDSFQAFSSTQS